ncbi:MAG: methyl-accepting chemotaxis protein [Litoreibacter sp.]
MQNIAAAALTSDQATTDQTTLNALISGLGYEIVDIAGFLDTLHETADDQLTTLSKAKNGLHLLNRSGRAVIDSVAKVADSSRNALDAVEQSVELVQTSSEKSQSVSGWVTEFGESIREIEDSLKSVHRANEEITEIAMQVNILAINASIEAARAGDAGRGFAVVATAINELSQHTSKAADDIADQIRSLTGTVQQLRSEAQVVVKDAQHIIQKSSDTDIALGQIANSIKQTTIDAQEIAEHADSVENASQNFVPAFRKLSSLATRTAEGVNRANTRSNALIERSEAIVQQTASLGGQSDDTEFIAYVQDAADRIGDVWEEMVKQGRISMDDLFDKKYVAIPNSNPLQVMTRFTQFADATLPPIQEAALEISPKVVFCTALDTSGYLPTHNNKFSQPQSDDPVWNAAHCRNRKIFDDRVGIKSGRNTKPFLLQVYRRDMGGGHFTMMKDLSSPIFVNGRHWGGLRMGYTFE